MVGDVVRPPLNAATLREDLTGPRLQWRQLDVVTATGSTNADLVARAAAGEDIDGVVLIAEHQTAGRGRYGRVWSTAPRAQINMSVGVGARAVATAAWGWLPLAAGVAVVDAVAAVAGIDAVLKWPNDVLADGGKLAGILSEVAAPQPIIVVGVGLNVTLRSDEVTEAGITSLLELGVEAPDRDRLVRRLLHEFGIRVAAWRNSGGASLIGDYRARSITIGSQVRAILPGDREIAGLARDVDEQGRLLIESDGRVFAVSAGDVAHLRPTDANGY